jgi:hypothetical protein
MLSLRELCPKALRQPLLFVPSGRRRLGTPPGGKWEYERTERKEADEPMTFSSTAGYADLD